MPTCFIGFLPAELIYVPGFMDHRLLTFMLSLPLVFIGPRAEKKDFKRIPGIWVLCFVGMTVILRMAWSLASNISLFEVVSVMRWNFTWPIYSVCVLHYASRLPVNRLYGVLRMFLLIFSLQVCLLTASLLSGVDFFLNKITIEKYYQYIDQGMVPDNLRAFPVFIFVGTAFLFMLVLRTNRWKKYHFLFLLSQFLPLLLMRRMYSVTLLLQTLSIYLIFTLLIKKTKTFILIPYVCLFAFVVLLSIAPVRFHTLFDKILPAVEAGYSPEKVGTYSFRLSLLDNAIYSVADNQRRLFGMGYRREYSNIKRKYYSYVMGEDSFLAPVIYCEGWGGLCLRILPYLVLLWYNLKRLLVVSDRVMKMYAATVVGVIIAQIPAFLQTAMICRYDYFFVPLAFVELIIIKGKRESL